MHTQCESMTRCSVHHSNVTLLWRNALNLIVAGTVIKCSIVLQTGIYSLVSKVITLPEVSKVFSLLFCSITRIAK